MMQDRNCGIWICLLISGFLLETSQVLLRGQEQGTTLLFLYFLIYFDCIYLFHFHFHFGFDLILLVLYFVINFFLQNKSSRVV